MIGCGLMASEIEIYAGQNTRGVLHSFVLGTGGRPQRILIRGPFSGFHLVYLDVKLHGQMRPHVPGLIGTRGTGCQSR